MCAQISAAKTGFTPILRLTTLVMTAAMATVRVDAIASGQPASSPRRVMTTVPLQLAQTADERTADADQLLQQGKAQLNEGQAKAALQSFQQALPIYRQHNQRLGEGELLMNLGNAYRALGDTTKAIETYQQSLAIARELNIRQGEGLVLGDLAVAYDMRGDSAKAIAYAQQSLTIAREVHYPVGEKNALQVLGAVYYHLSAFAQAINYFQQSLAIARTIKDPASEGNTLSNLGLVSDAVGDYANAISYYQQALAIAQQGSNRPGAGEILGNLGVTYYHLGEYAKAIEYHQQSLAIARQTNNAISAATTLGNLGTAYQDLGDYAKARDYYQQSLVIAQAINDRRDEGTALGNLGNISSKQGNIKQAITYQQQSLTIGRDSRDRLIEERALINLGIAYGEQGNYAAEVEYEQQGLTIARTLNDQLAQAQALNNLGFALFKANRLPAAETPLFDCIKVLESLRAGLGNNDAGKVAIFEQQSRVYRNLQQVLIAENKSDRALEVAERGRARAFVDLLARRITTRQVDPRSIPSPSLTQIKQIAKTEQATLVTYSIVTNSVNVASKGQTYESDLYIWVIQPTGAVTFRKVDLTPLWQQQTSLATVVSGSRTTIGVGNRGLGIVPLGNATSQSQTLRQLYDLLVQPIADQLPTDPTAHVIFIPQGALFWVPFAALQDAAGKFLIEQHTISIAPSIQVLSLTHQQRAISFTTTSTVLVAGDPTMPQVTLPGRKTAEQLMPLAGAKQEAIDVAKILNTQALLGSQATKRTVQQQMRSARIIHLATHGLLDDFKGLGVPGAIALAPDDTGQKNDGLLTADEILDMQLHANLVVLSACSTGLGNLTGDGVIGLSRSLITAGTPSVIVSLWSVPDAPTAFLMTQFYKTLQRDPDKAQALRQAMLSTKKDYPAPRDWAAFTLIGEAE